MSEEVANINWAEIMDKFLKNDGRVIDFCRENNIKPHQLYHQKNKLKKNTPQTFRILEVPKPTETENTEIPKQSVRIEIGNVNIYISSDDNNTILTLVRELSKSC